MRQIRIGSTKVTLLRGDITAEATDGIVNAANSSLMGGGGVDGAIHRAGGPEILEECRVLRARHGDLPTGEAVITTGGRLRARHVIHTVGPMWRGGSSREDELLANAYRNSLTIAHRHGLRSIAFPSISTGAYGFPAERASRIALQTVIEFLKTHPEMAEVRFVTFSQGDYDSYDRHLQVVSET